MKLLIQPRDGLSAVTSALRAAKREIDILIFRCDRPEIEKGLEAAVKRGVKVRALIAHTNNGGDKRLRKLEQNLLEAGASVARTGDEFIRYHAKYIVIDRSSLWLLGFNFTAIDTDRSRSFGVMTRERAQVQEALKLFEADRSRVPYESSSAALVVSPENSRSRLAQFIEGARQELLIYDPKVGDPGMIKLLLERQAAGVDVRIIGKVGKPGQKLSYEKYPGKRLHVRAIVRDRKQAFIGSQSLRRLELESRREVGLLIRQAPIVREIARTFDEDWALTDSGKRELRRGTEGRVREGDRASA